MADDAPDDFAFDEIAMAHARHLHQLERARASYVARRDALMNALSVQVAKLVLALPMERINARFEAVGEAPVYATYIASAFQAARAAAGDPDDRTDGFWFGFLTDETWSDEDPQLAFRGHLVFSVDAELHARMRPAFEAVAEQLGGEMGRGAGYTWMSVTPVPVDRFTVQDFATMVTELPETFARVDQALAQVYQGLDE